MFFFKKKPKLEKLKPQKHRLDYALGLISHAKRIFNKRYRDKRYIPTKREMQKYYLIQGRLRRTYKKARRVTVELQRRYDQK